MLMFQTTTAQAVGQATGNVTGVFANMGDKIIAALPNILTALIVFVIFYIVARVGKGLIALAAPRVRADTGVVLLLSRIYFYGVLILGLLTALPLTGLDVSALVAGIGLTGFALGFALKDVLSNLLAGIMLLMYRPFNIGDHIKMLEHEGVIQTIRMRDTVLRAYDGRLIIIPNTKLITEVVVNNSSIELAQEKIRASVDAEVDPTKTRDVMRRALDAATLNSSANNEGKQQVEAMVSLTKSDAQHHALEGCFWYDPRRTNTIAIKREVRECLLAAFAQSGINATILDDAKLPVVMEKPAEDSGGEKQVERPVLAE